MIGYIEVETSTRENGCPRHGGSADIGNLRVTEPYRRRGVASWLLGQAADWLRLADVDRLLDYAWLEGTDPGGHDYADYRAFLGVGAADRGHDQLSPCPGHGDVEEPALLVEQLGGQSGGRGVGGRSADRRRVGNPARLAGRITSHHRLHELVLGPA